MMDYLDFELEIERMGRGRRRPFRARVIDAPAGGRAQTFFGLPPAAVGWEPDHDSNSRAAGARHLSREPMAEASASAVGRELFDRVLASGSIRSRWRVSLEQARAKGKGLRLRLHLPDDAELLSVPWELLYDPNRSFLARSEETPIVRMIDVAVPRRSMVVEGSVRVVALLSCPAGTVPLQVEKEWEVLDQALAPRLSGEQITLEHLARPTLQELLRYLRAQECHVLHFIGHGTCAEGFGAIALENGRGDLQWVDHEKLEAFFGHQALRLVVLNACEGAKPGLVDPLAGVAQSLVRQGVPAVVAMQWDVSDSVAIEFTRQFYSALAEGFPVDAAMSRARQGLAAIFEGPAWAIPVLYMNAWEGDIWPNGKKPKDNSRPETEGGIEIEPKTGVRRWIKEHWPSSTGIMLSAVIAASLLFLYGGFRRPRDASSNPPECPSPPELNMAFEKISPGTFIMGDEGAKESRPTHRVTISRPFCIGTYEVTQKQIAQVSGSPPPKKEERYLPASGIKYDAAQDFVRVLNENDPARPYRLPTEAEWEYVARGKSKMKYSFLGNSNAPESHANCGEPGDGFDGPTWVGQFPPNPWGVYDMHGNVFEWVSDWYGPYSDQNVQDPIGPEKGEKRIRRGGGWKSDERVCTSTHRSIVQPDWSDKYTGFRIVREIR